MKATAEHTKQVSVTRKTVSENMSNNPRGEEFSRKTVTGIKSIKIK